MTASNYSSGASTLPQTVSLINQQTVSLFFTMILPYSLKSGTTLLLTLFNSSYLNLGGNCTSPFPSCSNSTNPTTGNIEVTFAAIAAAPTAGTLLQVELLGVTIFSYQEVQVKGSLSVGGFASLESGFISLPLLYAETVSAYSIAQTSHILGATSDVTLSFTLSAQTRGRLSYLKVFVPQ